MKWTRAAREMRCETLHELVEEDPTRSLVQLKAFLQHRHGIEVSKRTVKNDLARLGYSYAWVRLEGWSSEIEDAGAFVQTRESPQAGGG